MRKLVGCGILVLFFFCCAAQNNDATLVLKRYKEYLQRMDTATSCSSIPPVDPDGRWSDINYSDNQPGLWQLSVHLNRIRSLALCVQKGQLSGEQAAAVKTTISLALRDWFTHRYQSKNWWHNEIGVPQTMRDILVLLKENLTKDETANCLQILDQHKVKGTGANLVWSADLGLHYGALTNDTALMRHCRDTILTVIKISTAEGVQPDFSFHQHGRRLQMYHYGGAFLVDDIRLAWQLEGTSLAFPKEKIDVLTDFVLKGWQWMTRGIHTVPGTIDRAASRKNALRSADIRLLVPLLYRVNPDRTAAFRHLLRTQNGQDALQGYRYFPYSDFTAFQQLQYSFFLKTASTRTLLTESINEENLKGDLLDGGDAYFLSNGNEYDNFLPFWDWDRLPGMTNFNGDGKRKLIPHAFVGNVSDGSSGLAVMDYALQKGTHTLQAKKLWASWKNTTVALIAGLQPADLLAGAFTTLEQSRLQGPVTANREGHRIDGSLPVERRVKWVHHQNFVYLPLASDSVTVNVKEVEGSWYAINHSESKAVLHDRRFLVSLHHQQSATGYAVSYAPSAKAAAAIARHPAWTVLRNDTLCQAVRFSDGTLMAAFYKEGRMASAASGTISVDMPCLFLQDRRRIFVSDPLHKGGTLTLFVKQKKYTVDLPADGSTVEVKTSPQ
ncbi:polysaccharide lyase family 8 super-sandwich domain-containing protein [Flavisolibacter nicotianae]|uniref:polysaccharide lyase family 8 super-sandwich domain-containing protein n=1 Tax=Flavisolibacter nicotianae TaxID=2364882 RepID=UPI0013C4BCE0|nr:polysaccharide lyase family 8 super-sandwich domain-containing protein [Flavisolibacter nicotianae]